MTHEPRRGCCVHAPELLDPLQQKEQQDQADDQIHSCKAFDWAGVLPKRRGPDSLFPRETDYAKFTPLRICDNKSRAAESASASRASAPWPPAA